MARKKQTPAPAPVADDRPDQVVWYDLPGVVAIGHYRPRTEYTVPAAEAERLLKIKGFRRGPMPAAPVAVTDGDAKLDEETV